MDDQSVQHRQDPIAVIGIGCRFPGDVNSPQAFWQQLLSSFDAVGDIPLDRWDTRQWFHPDQAQPGKTDQRHGAFLKNVDQFDPAFFGISAVEASRLDPQQRLLLEVSYEALEDAGIPLQRVSGSAIAVFIGICTTEYRNLQQQDPTSINPYTNAGGTGSIAANRLSYFFDWHGPSLSVDTACSSSLVAVHLACQSLRKGECALALAGGVGLLFHPATSVGFSKAQMLSPTGRCASFDASADGYVRGEGAGVILLKPLAQAEADGDPIYGVIRGTGVNQDGRTPGLHYPSQSAQEALLSEVYRNAGIDPAQVHYIEAHGTGTIVGDRVEAHALGTMFATSHSSEQPLHIGSVKTNIGHLEGASGMAGLIKTLLILQHRQIPASLHFERPNPSILFEELHLKVPTEVETIPAALEPLIAGVNSFGFGGTNAHVALQAYRTPVSTPPDASDDESNRPLLLPLSAHSLPALRNMVLNYQELLKSTQLRDLCFTAAHHRTHHQERLALVVASQEEAEEQLAAFLQAPPASSQPVWRMSKGKEAMAFVFSGNGSQWWGMGHALLQQHAFFREVVERCDQQWQPLAGWSLMEELLKDASSSRMAETEVAQPTLFAVQIALVELWKEWGIEPQVVIGHSVGEIAAAYVAGILSFEDALTVVYHRARLQEMTAGKGTMVAVGISPELAKELIAPFGPHVALAAVNTPNSVTLSGDEELLHQIIEPLAQQNIFCRFLKLNYAFHSAQMEPLREALLHSLRHLHPQEARIPFISTVRGSQIVGTECDGEYWWHNVRQPVQFAAGIEQILDLGIHAFLEIGPHPVLSTYVGQCLGERDGQVWPSLRRGGSDLRQILTTLGDLYVRGCRVCWEHILPPGRRVYLPHYPWQRERYWNEGQGTAGTMAGGPLVHPLLGYRLPTALLTWEQVLDAPDLQYLFDHQFEGVAIFPLAGHTELLLAVASHLSERPVCVLERVKVAAPLFLRSNQPTRLQTTVEAGEVTIRASSSEQEHGTVHVIGHLSEREAPHTQRVDLQAIHARCPELVTADAFYKACLPLGFQYGPAFQLIEHIWLGEQEAIGIVRLPERTETCGVVSQGYALHPALMDSCLQVICAVHVAQTDQNKAQSRYLPVGYERLYWYKQPPASAQIYSHARLVKRGLRQFVADYRICDEEGTLLVEIVGLRGQFVAQEKNKTDKVAQEWLYQEQWSPAPLHEERAALPAPSLVSPGTPERLAECSQQPVPTFNKLCLDALVHTLHQLGWNLQSGTCFTLQERCERLAILPRYIKLLHTWCLFLSEEGILTRDGDGWRVLLSPEKTPGPDTLLGALLRHAPDEHARLLLLVCCIPNLVAVLRGDIDPRGLLFPDGNMRMVEQAYTNDLSLRRASYQLQDSLRTIIEHLPTNRHLRILEIGAGTGGTTSYVLPVLPAERSTYVFTDISEFFLKQAQQKYQCYPFVEYRLFDLNQDPAAQGLATGDFDLVIASNVVHATANLRRSLKHIHELLSAQGLFYLLEITNPFLAEGLFVFGLLEEFWQCQDQDVRPEFPTLKVTNWQQELEHAGFTETVILTSPCASGTPDQSLFLSQRGSHENESQAEPDIARQYTWLILEDEQGVAKQLGEHLSDQFLIRVRRGSNFQRVNSTHFVVRSEQAQDLQQVLSILRQEGHDPEQVVSLWGLVESSEQEPDAQTLSARVKSSCLDLLILIKTLLHQHSGKLPRLWVITRGVQAGVPVTGEPQEEMPHVSPQIMLAPLYGLTRVIANEHPELHPTIIDLSSPGDPSSQDQTWYEIVALAAELRAQANVSEVCLRGVQRFLNRIERAPLKQQLRSNEVQAHPDLAFRLALEVPGQLSTLSLCTMSKRQPGPGEVAIDVVIAGLNFRDVAIALGLIAPDAIAESSGYYVLGSECAGRVAALGEGVTDFHLEEEVIAFGTFGPFISSRVVVDAGMVVRKPAQVSMEAAGGILCVFLTAYYGLHKLAHLQAGERVLIHGAAGGVGLAAIQIVQQAGGEVFATAGTPQKRAYLRALGVEHVFDSRSLAFVDEIMQLTNGEGVDIVLNSVAGKVAAHSLELLRSFGRFLEIGKRDIQEQARLELASFERCLTYCSIDLVRLQQEAPNLFKRLLRELMEAFPQRNYTPLPYSLYPLDQVVEAFRSMQQSQHIGKIVIQIQGQSAPVEHQPSMPPLRFRQDGSYLITGGLSGLGLATASFLAAHGARHVILASRRGEAGGEAAPVIEQLRQMGAQVVTMRLDVTREQEMVAVFRRIAQEMPPLRGIIHAAMVISDHSLLQMDEQSWEEGLAPKMLGAWHLHRCSLGLPLDFFICYSSGSASSGMAMQGNYVAGNAFLEALARFRQAQGLPALTVSWGALAKIGYVARNTTVHEYLDMLGFRAMDPRQALDLLGKALQARRIQTIVGDFDWKKVSTAFSNPAVNRRWRHLEQQGPAQGELHTVPGAVTADEERQSVTLALQQLLQEVVGRSRASIGLHDSLKELGIDSLLAMELRASLKRHLGVDIPVVQLLQFQRVADIAERIEELLLNERQRESLPIM